MVSTEQARELFHGGEASGRGLIATHPEMNVTYEPRQMSRALKESAFFKALDAKTQERLIDLVGFEGFGRNALCMAFPHMAPDNNNLLFGDLLAKFFVLNKNRDAAKTYDTWTNPGEHDAHTQ
jgi:hypothetical protein